MKDKIKKYLNEEHTLYEDLLDMLDEDIIDEDVLDEFIGSNVLKTGATAVKGQLRNTVPMAAGMSAVFGVANAIGKKKADQQMGIRDPYKYKVKV